MSYNQLVHGKNSLEGLVSIEVNDTDYELFIQDEQGNITSEIHPYRSWLLSDKKLSNKFVKLNGDLHYKYGLQFNSQEEAKKTNYFYSKKKNEDTYFIWNAKEQVMLKDGLTYYKNLNPKDVSVLAFDLETTSLKPEQGEVILISNTFRSKQGIEKKLFSIDEYESEADMLIDWCNFILDKDPSILTGHNIFSFDFNYLVRRSEILDIDLCMGRNGSPITQNKNPSTFRIDGSRDQDYNNISCYGREIIDTLFLAYRYDIVKKKYDSYGLKPIIKAEKLEKLNRTFYDASQIRFNYTNPKEMEKIKAYCIDDSDDALAVFDLMAPAYFYQTQYCTRSFQHLHQSATGALINGILVRSYLQNKHSIPKATPLEKLAGGVSFAIPGIYRNVMKVDLKSAYPSQVLRFKLYDKTKDPEANYYNLVKFFTEQRFHYKKMFKETGDKKWEDLDATAKIFINSAYGACSTNGLQFNSPVVAAKITEETRNVIDMALKWASGEGKDFWMSKFKEIVGDDTEDTEDAV